MIMGKMKRVLDGYREREYQLVQTIRSLKNN